MTTDSVHVVGAGGIGCAVGYALRRAGFAVVFVDANPAKVEAGRRDGVAVAGLPPLPAEFVHFADWHPTTAAPVLLCTKCYDNPVVLDRLSAEIVLVPVQNGFDPRLEASRPRVEGIASFVSECDRDRPRTRITRRGELHVGRLAGVPQTTGADTVMGTLARTDLFPVLRVTTIDPFKYTKLMYNAAISPLAAAAGVDNGALLSDPVARRLFFGLIRENYAILSAAGVELGKVGPFHPRTVSRILRRGWLARLMARFFEPSLRGTYCSMAGEIQKGRTEIDNYNGHLIRVAGDRTPCPLNRAVYDLVTRMQRERMGPDRGVLRQIEKAQG